MSTRPSSALHDLVSTRLANILGQGVIGPFRRMHDLPHNEPHVLAINVPDRSSSDQPMKCIGFPLGNAFHFPFLERDRATFGRFAKACAFIAA